MNTWKENITEADFLKYKKTGMIVLYGTDWCVDCTTMKYKFIKLSNDPLYKDIKFIYMNLDNTTTKYIRKFDITNIP